MSNLWKLEVVLDVTMFLFDYVLFVKSSFFEKQECNYMGYTILLSYILGKEIRVLTEAITERSRAMAIVVTVVMFRSPSGRGYNQSPGI